MNSKTWSYFAVYFTILWKVTFFFLKKFHLRLCKDLLIDGLFCFSSFNLFTFYLWFSFTFSLTVLPPLFYALSFFPFFYIYFLSAFLSPRLFYFYHLFHFFLSFLSSHIFSMTTLYLFILVSSVICLFLIFVLYSVFLFITVLSFLDSIIFLTFIISARLPSL